eukprot:m.118152 g.118152  ORF g.118152 m.118152 type:complete len:1458 (+) comp9225_c1_seq2:77-4450(+)
MKFKVCLCAISALAFLAAVAAAGFSCSSATQPAVSAVSPLCGPGPISVSGTNLLAEANVVVLCQWWSVPCSGSAALIANTTGASLSASALQCDAPASAPAAGRLALSVALFDPGVPVVPACSSSLFAAPLANASSFYVPSCDASTVLCSNISIASILSASVGTYGPASIAVSDPMDCAASISLPAQNYSIGTTLVPLRYNGTLGLSRACTMAITVVDVQPATVTCPPNGTRFPLSRGAETATVQCLAGVAFSVACGGFIKSRADVKAVYQSPSATTPLPAGPAVFIFTIMTVNGINTTCNTSFLIVDSEVPAFVCPGNITVPENPNGPTALVRVPFNISDNSGLASVSVTRVVGPAGNTSMSQSVTNFSTVVKNYISVVSVEAPPGARVALLVTATDKSGNMAGCNATINFAQSSITSQILAVGNLIQNATVATAIEAVSNITTGANMSASQVALLAPMINSIVTNAISRNYTNMPNLFNVLDSIGSQPPAVLVAAGALGNTTTQLRDSVALVASALVSQLQNSDNATSTSASITTQGGSASKTAVLVGASMTITVVVAEVSGANAVTAVDFSAGPARFSLTTSSISTSNGTTFGAAFIVYNDARLFSSDTSTAVVTPVVDVTLSHSVLNGSMEFSMLPSGYCQGIQYQCAYWGNGTWLSDGLSSTNTDAGVLCSTVHLTNFAVLVDASDASASGAHDEALSIITVVGCMLSLIGLVLTVAVHSGIPRLRQAMPSRMLLNLCVALACGLLLFIIASYVTGTTTITTIGTCTTISTSVPTQCQVVGILLHYFWLAALLWMVMEGIQLHAVVVIVLGLRTARRYKIYLLTAWGLPAIIVALTLGIEGARVYGSASFCWINDQRVLIWAFLAPLAACVALNTFLFSIIASAIWNSRRGSKEDAGLSRHSSLRQLRSCASIFALLGLSWLFGALINTSSGSGSLTLQYLFALFTTLQGFAVFIFNCALSDQVRETLRQMVSSPRTRTPRTQTNKGAVSDKKRPRSNKTSPYLPMSETSVEMSVHGDSAMEPRSPESPSDSRLSEPLGDPRGSGRPSQDERMGGLDLDGVDMDALEPNVLFARRSEEIDSVPPTPTTPTTPASVAVPAAPAVIVSASLKQRRAPTAYLEVLPEHENDTTYDLGHSGDPNLYSVLPSRPPKPTGVPAKPAEVIYDTGQMYAVLSVEGPQESEDSVYDQATPQLQPTVRRKPTSGPASSGPADELYDTRTTGAGDDTYELYDNRTLPGAAEDLYGDADIYPRATVRRRPSVQSLPDDGMYDSRTYPADEETYAVGDDHMYSRATVRRPSVAVQAVDGLYDIGATGTEEPLYADDATDGVPAEPLYGDQLYARATLRRPSVPAVNAPGLYDLGANDALYGASSSSDNTGSPTYDLGASSNIYSASSLATAPARDDVSAEAPFDIGQMYAVLGLDLLADSVVLDAGPARMAGKSRLSGISDSEYPT